MSTDHQLYDRLTRRLHERDIRELCLLANGEKGVRLREKLVELAGEENDRVRYNALWALTHFTAEGKEWLYTCQSLLVEMAMEEKHSGCLRLLLTVLNGQSFADDKWRADFFDFCLNLIADYRQAVSARAMALKLAYKMGCCHPELLVEIRLVAEQLSCENISPALTSAIKMGEREVSRAHVRK